MKIKPKYLSRLTKKQWLALHRACFTELAEKVASVKFWDDGSEEALLLDTNYRYMDFDPPVADDVWDGVDRFERGKGIRQGIYLRFCEKQNGDRRQWARRRLLNGKGIYRYQRPHGER